VDDDLLPLERGVKVRDDADLPRLADAKGFRRRAVLAAPAERTLKDLLVGYRVELRQPGARAAASAGRKEDAPTGQRIDARVGQLLVRSLLAPSSSSGRKSSIGSGRMSVELRSELTSSIVWRNRS
jgi:hypothetical protein